jgi:hypothetical protein
MRSTILTAGLLTVLCCGTASAQMHVYYHQGSWDAFSGPTADGRQVCGVGSTNPTDNRSFSLRFDIGGDTVSFQAKKPSWNIPANTQIPVVMQLGLDAPWNMQAAGNGKVVEWTMDRNTVQTFDEQFRRGTSMTLSFPTGNEAPWSIGLNGSTAISNAFGRCVTEMTARANPQPPTAQTAPVDQGPTQPFGQTQAPPLAQQGQPAPQQPPTPLQPDQGQTVQR